MIYITSTSLGNHFGVSARAGNMSAVVLDFQGFQLQPHTFVVKELAFFDMNYGYHARWSFQPPHAWEKLSRKRQKTYAWVIRNCHSMPWESGDLPYTDLRPILISLFTAYSQIYVKGLEKVKFLEKLSGKIILDLNDMQCPKVDTLPIPNMACADHSPNFKFCALNKAAAFAHFCINRQTD